MSMWKTVSMRIRGAKSELEEMGEDTDGIVESTAELRDLVKSITGFDIMLDENTFKSTYDIVVGIGKVYDKLSDINQASLLEALAGKRRGNALASALNNVEDIEKAYQSAENSAGSAMKEQKEFEKSIQYSINQFKESFQELSNSVVDSDLIKDVVDGGTNIISVLTNIISLLDKVDAILPLIISSVMTLSDKKLLDWQNGSLGILGSLFNKDTQPLFSETDIDLINQYNMGIKTANFNVNEFIESVENPTLKTYLTNLKGVPASVDATAKSVATLGVKAKLASVGWGLLNTAMNAGVMMVASFAIQGVVELLDKLIVTSKEAKEIREQEKQQALEFVEINKEEYNQLKEIIDEYEAMGEILSPTVEEKDKLNSIQEKLNDLYDTEAKNIDVVNGRYDEQLNKIKALNIEKAKDIYRNQHVANANFGGDKEVFDKDNNTYYFGGLNNSEEFLKEFSQIEGAYLAKDGLLQNIIAGQTGYKFGNWNLEGTKQAIELMEEYNYENTDLYQNIVKSYETSKQAIEDRVASLKTEIEAGETANVSEEKLIIAKQELARWTEQLNIVTEEEINTQEKLANKLSQVFSMEDSLANLENFKSQYDSLSEVVADYNETGLITIENIQTLMSISPDYLQFLTDENNHLGLNTEALNKLAIARIDDAEASFLSDATARIADLQNETGATEYLKTAKLDEAEARLEVAKSAYTEAMAKAMLNNNSDVVNQALKTLNQTVIKSHAIFNTARASVGKYNTALTETGSTAEDVTEKMSDAQSAINDLLSKTISMLNQKYSDQKEALQDRIDTLNELKDIDTEQTETELENIKKKIQAQLDLLEAEKDRHDYELGLKEKNKDIEYINNELSEIQFDDSEKTKKTRLELQEQLAEKQSELDEYQYDHSIELQENALNEEQDRVEELYEVKLNLIEQEYQARIDSLEKQIQAIEDYTSNEYNIRMEAMKLIEGKTDEFYQQLLEWNRKYGTGLDADIRNSWIDCYEALDMYNQGQYKVLDTLEMLTTQMHDLENTSNSVATSLNNVASGINNIDFNGFDEFANQLQDLENIKVGFDFTQYAKSPKSFMDMAFDNIKFPTFHSGGIVSDVSSNSNEAKRLFELANDERLAKVQVGEAVFTPPQMDNILKRVEVSNISTTTKNISNIPNIQTGNVIIQGNADAQTVKALKSEHKNIVQDTVNAMFKRMNKLGYQG